MLQRYIKTEVVISLLGFACTNFDNLISPVCVLIDRLLVGTVSIQDQYQWVELPQAPAPPTAPWVDSLLSRCHTI